MYLNHDFSTPLIHKFFQQTNLRRLKSAMLEYWPRMLVCTEAQTVANPDWGEESGLHVPETIQIGVPGTEVEVFCPRVKVYDGAKFRNDKFIALYKALGMTPDSVYGSENVESSAYNKCVASIDPTLKDTIVTPQRRQIPAVTAYDVEVQKCKTSGESDDSYNSGWDIGGIEKIWLELNPANYTAIDYSEVASYIESNSVLMSNTVTDVRTKYIKYKPEIERWIASDDFSATPWYTDDPLWPDFPQTAVEATNALRLTNTPEWREVKIKYSDRPSAVYIKPTEPDVVEGVPYWDWSAEKTGSVVNPEKLTNDEILRIIQSGYHGSLNADTQPVQSELEESGAVTSITRDQWENSYRYSAFANGTIEIVLEDDDKIGWMPLMLNVDPESPMFSRVSSKYRPPTDHTYDETSTYTAPVSIWETQFNITSNTIRIDTSSDNATYYDDNNKLQYLTRYIREVHVTMRYKRVRNAFNNLSDFATIAATPPPEISWVASNTGYNLQVEHIADVLSYFYPNRSTMDGYIKKSLNDIQDTSALAAVTKGKPYITNYIEETVYSNPPAYGSAYNLYETQRELWRDSFPYGTHLTEDEQLTYMYVRDIGEYSMNYSSFINCAEFEALSVKDAADLIGQSIGTNSEATKASGLKRYLGAIIIVIAVVVSVLIPPAAPAAGAAATAASTAGAVFGYGIGGVAAVWTTTALVLTIGSIWAAKNGQYAFAMSLGKAQVIAGAIATFTGITAIVNNINTATAAVSNASKGATEMALAEGATASQAAAAGAKEAAVVASKYGGLTGFVATANVNGIGSAIAGLLPSFGSFSSLTLSGMAEYSTTLLSDIVTRFDFSSIPSTFQTITGPMDMMFRIANFVGSIMYKSTPVSSDNLDADAPMTPDTMNSLEKYSGGELFRNQYDMNEEMQCIMKEMCEAPKPPMLYS